MTRKEKVLELPHSERTERLILASINLFLQEKFNEYGVNFYPLWKK